MPEGFRSVRTFRLHHELDSKLASAAHEQGLSVSELLRSMAQRNLEQQVYRPGSEAECVTIDPAQIMSAVAQGGTKISKQCVLDSLSNTWNQDFFCARHEQHDWCLVLLPIVRPNISGLAR